MSHGQVYVTAPGTDDDGRSVGLVFGRKKCCQGRAADKAQANTGSILSDFGLLFVG